VLDHDSPVALPKQLAAILRGQIGAGELAGRVPSILTIAQQYEVSHNTAHRALLLLKDEGLIMSAPGRGFYVVRKPGGGSESPAL
jgi:DNA-binding GntR family transcriptional regulator